MVDLGIGHLAKQVRNAIEAGFLLIHRLYNPPRCLWNVSALQHYLFGLGVLLPADSALQIHGAQLPLLERIVDATQEADMLLLIGNGEPVLDKPHARTHQHLFKFRHRAEEFLVLILGAEPHHFLDTSTVVPTTVKQHDFTGRRQMRDIPLEIPLRALAIIGGR